MASENIDVDCEGVSLLPFPPHVALRYGPDEWEDGLDADEAMEAGEQQPDDIAQTLERNFIIARQVHDGVATAMAIAAGAGGLALGLPYQQDGPQDRIGWNAFSLGAELQRQLDPTRFEVDEDEEEVEDEVYDSLRFRLLYEIPSDTPLAHGARRAIELGSWVQHPNRKQIASAMRRSSKVPASEVEGWCLALGLPYQDVAWERARREKLQGSAKALSTKRITRILPIFQRELRERLAARPFDVFIDGKSVYDLDRKALEELVVLVDWHLNRGGA